MKRHALAALLLALSLLAGCAAAPAVSTATAAPAVVTAEVTVTVTAVATPAPTPTASAAPTPYAGENALPYPSGYDTDTTGASSYKNCGDHPDAGYFAAPDVYNMISAGTLTVLPHFKTYQQTTEWSCGNATALMVLNHYGNTEWDELAIAKIMKSNTDLDKDNKEHPGAANERGEYGTSTTGMVTFFQHIGWKVQSSILPEQKAFQASLSDPAVFTKWVIGNLKNNTPIMVEWIDWGGHWQNIIGYDTMGTDDNFEDDVLLLADPYDATDHKQDGYYTFSASRFYYMWFDAHILPEDQTEMQWVIATPK